VGKKKERKRLKAEVTEKSTGHTEQREEARQNTRRRVTWELSAMREAEEERDGAGFGKKPQSKKDPPLQRDSVLRNETEAGALRRCT
jgi:hypothetical protein